MSRFRKSDWIELGWKQLSQNGPDGLKIDILCDLAGRSKGSFYHHFEDYDAFLTQLTDAWVKRQTTDLMADFDPSQPVDAQMDAMFEAVIALDYRFELGMRELARKFPQLAVRVTEVDRMRLEFSAEMYRLRFGVPKDEAEHLATLDYAVLTGLILLDPDMSADRQKALYETYDALLVAKYRENAE